MVVGIHSQEFATSIKFDAVWHAQGHLSWTESQQGGGDPHRGGAGHGAAYPLQDADLGYDTADYPALLQPILDDQADVIFGNRFHAGPHRVLYCWHMVGNRVLTTLCNMVTNLNLTDMEVGYTVFRAEV